jgi:enoyl-CoA hydratase
MEYENVTVEKQEGIAVVTINRPKVLNALNAATISELQTVFERLEDDEEVRVVILTGSGEKGFVAGADISELQKVDVFTGRELSERGLKLLFTIERLSKPVIAAVNGFALGGGCEISMACDVRIAADSAKLGQPEVNLGLIPGYGGTQRLARLVGRGKAKQLIFTGDMVDAQEAKRIGLVDEVVPLDELMPYVKKLAAKIASKAPMAVSAAKRAINQGVDKDLDEGCLIESMEFGQVCGTEDKNEGTKAFLDKRKPEFRGR